MQEIPEIVGLIPGWGRSPWAGNGNLFQYFCLENPKNKVVWQATVHSFAKSQTDQAAGHTLLICRDSVEGNLEWTDDQSHCYLVTQSCVTFCDPMWRQASLSFTISWSLLKLMSIETVMPSNHLILCHPFLLLPSIFPRIRVFSNGWACHIRWLKYWSFSFSINPCDEYSGLIFIRVDWFDLLAVQGTLKSLLQHHSSKASALSLIYGPTLTSIHDY